MFKDYNKYLSTSLKVYLFVLIIIFIMKLVGLDYFGLDIDNPILFKINNICLNFKLDYIYSYIVCYLTSYVTISLTLNESNLKLHKFMIITFPLTIAVKYLGYYINGVLYVILQLLFLYILAIIYQRKISKKSLIRYIKYNVILLIIQSISILLRNLNVTTTGFNFITSIIINIDYILMILIYHKITLEKGDFICYQTVEVGLSLLKKLNLKNFLKKLQKNLHNFKKENKVTKITIIIYSILSFFWNVLSVAVILLVANLNDTFIECIFILTSFWLSKGAFGKAFHLPSMLQCFVVSNLSYYILNRLTTPLGISIIIPIMLGVGLSYVTSKLVKKTYKPLYRGMPEDIFEETILKVVDKNSLKYKICYEFYIKKKSVVSLSIKYNYTEAGIRKIKDRINEKIKGLN